MPENTCICCGAIIPEGRMVCPSCENSDAQAKKILTNGDHIRNMTNEELIPIVMYYVCEKYNVAKCPTDNCDDCVRRWLKMESRMDKHIDISTDDNLGAICICAVRYALGRRTYMPSVVCRFIKAHLQQMENKELYVIKRDITEHGAGNPEHYGDECDYNEWMLLLAAVEAEIRRRKELKEKGLAYV